ncbi:MAG TPA: ATP-binding protein, partial [Oculatellaceae cyanobacterium]
ILKHRLKATEKQSKIQIVKEYGNLPLVECYPGQLNQVFMNLLANAIDALEEATEKLTGSEYREPHEQSSFSPTIWIRTELKDEDSNGLQVTQKQKVISGTKITDGLQVIRNSEVTETDRESACNQSSVANDDLPPRSDRNAVAEGSITPSSLDASASGLANIGGVQERSLTHVLIRIADNGSGMTEAVRDRLFDPFFTTKPIGKGTGLGLSISYRIIVEKHKGQLLVNSEQGQGTEFIIELPLQQSS